MEAERPDLTDPDVFELLYRNHVPEEHVTKRTDGLVVHQRIECEKCGQPWPCSTKKLLDDTDQPSRPGWSSGL